MAKNQVASVGARASLMLGGTYRLIIWYNMLEGRQHEEQYENLSWNELQDALAATWDATRPGFELGDGWRQPDLFSDLDAPWG